MAQNSTYLELLPAVDVADGKAVRLTQGEAGSETDYGSPLEAAQTWIEAGAEWIHLVDLDAAFGRGDNRAIIREVVNASTSVKIELSGGIRDDASLEAALEAGGMAFDAHKIGVLARLAPVQRVLEGHALTRIEVKPAVFLGIPGHAEGLQAAFADFDQILL